MAIATRDDVIARYIGNEPLEEEVLAVVDIRLNDAEILLKNRIPDLVAQANESADFTDAVVLVESEMVLRLIRNPEGYSQESDGNYSYAIYQQVASGRLEVLADEWDLLGSKKGMFVISPILPCGLEEGQLDPWKVGWEPPNWWQEY